jgi:hypothetical protein
MAYKFEQLEVWHLSLEYIDSIYKLGELLPPSQSTGRGSYLSWR